MNAERPGGGDRAVFTAWLDRHGIATESSIRERLFAFGELLERENARLGLIAPGDVPRFLTRHVQECVAPCLLDLVRQGSRLLDVGSGAGLPGLALAIVLPEIAVALVEPRQRRASFLDRAALALGLRNVRVIPSTLEDAARIAGLAPAEVLTARALRWTSSMLRTLPELLVPEGVVVRFGAPDLVREGVQVLPLEATAPRAIQVWKRTAWEALPDAR